MDIAKGAFVEGSPQKSIWFKNVIEEFYIKNYTRALTIVELRELNREVISYMMDNLRAIQKRQQNIATPLQKVAAYQEFQTEYSRNNAAPVKVDDLFSKRQKDYETMFNKPPPPEVNFSENVKDEPISNIEELIKAQQKQREYDMQLSNESSTPKITIHGQENVSLPFDVSIENESKKKVSWSDENEMRNDILLIKNQIEALSDKMENMRNDLILEIKTLLIPKSE
jgi:hypothetical protein